MKRTKSIYLALLAVLLLPMAAHAVPIDGAIGINGGLQPTCSTAPAVCTMDIADGVDFLDDMGGVGFATGDFATFLTPFLSQVNLTDFVFDPFATVAALWSGGGFTFELNTLAIGSQSSTGLALSGTGTVSGNGFDATAGAWSFSADTTQFSGGIFSWSSTTSNAPNPVPEPGTLALLGLGLAGMSMTRRKKKV